jgi:TRAP-type mannitol/chloroaromatic compound transport system permease small subunit
LLGFATIIDRAVGAIGIAASFLTLPMICVILLEVVLRYFFNAPTIWALESAQIMFGFMFLLGAAYTLREDGHVRVEIAYMYTGKRATAGLKIFALLFVFLYCGTVLYYGGIRALDAISIEERHFSVWSPIVYPVISMIPVAAGLMILHGLAQLIREVARLRGDD